MMSTNPSTRNIRSWQPAVKSIILIATAVLIAMTTGICPTFACSGAAGGAGPVGDPPPIGVACALPYAHGDFDLSCDGLHTIAFKTSNTDANAKVTAELMGLDVRGNLIKSFIVQNGDLAQLGSRLSPRDWRFAASKHLFEVFAPVPLLHVTVEDQGQKAEAFCSDIPYIQVEQPTGGVVTDSSGNNTNVFAAIPLTDPKFLHLYVDGVDLLKQVPHSSSFPTYLACTALAPCSGTATINGNAVSYSNLIVDIAPRISSLSSNTVQVTLTDLTCGGHNFHVSSARLPLCPFHVANTCNVDTLTKTATSSVFAISITDPTPGEVTAVVPTPVEGQVCSGTQITDVSINGKDLGATGETFTAGNGITTGNVYKVPINTTLDKTDLVRSAFGDHANPLGTFDPGSNRLAASATDIMGNRTFKNLIFATGSVAPVAVDPNATVFNAEAMRNAVNSQLKNLVQKNVQTALDAPTSTTLQNAFVVGLSASGAQTLFNKLCTSPVPSTDPTINGKTPGQIFSDKVTQAIEAIPLSPIDVSPPCVTCTAPVNFSIKSVNVGSDVTCNLTFNSGSFHVSMGLPEIDVAADAQGWCEDDLCIPDVGCTCGSGVAVGIEGTASVTGVKLDFDVTEANLLGNTTSPPAFFSGTTATGAHDIGNHFGDSGISFCGISEVCKVVVEIFTFGQVDLTPTIDISKVQDFSAQIGANQPDPVKLHQIQVDPTVIANFDQKASGSVSEVHITPSGITAGLVGQFATLAVDASVPATPGVTLTPAPVPTLPVPNAKDIFVGISDDAINMMFASLTAAGRLQTGDPSGNGCINTGSTVGSILPADCDTLNIPNSTGGTDDVATAAARGYCHAIKGDACGSLTYDDPALSPTDNANIAAAEQGECYGAQGLPAGQTCSTVANGNLLVWGACQITPNFNLHAAQPLLFCAKADVPPRMLFPDNPGTGTAVPAVLRIPSLSVALVVDRDEDNQVPGPFAAVPGCFTQGTSTAVDCNAFSACLDLNLDFSMAFETCSQDNKPGFLPTFQDIQVLPSSSLGTVCGGATSPTSDSDVLSQSSNTQITIPLGQNGAGFAPPICGAGLDLGGFVNCANPGVLSIRTENTFPESRDYLAITCNVQ